MLLIYSTWADSADSLRHQKKVVFWGSSKLVRVQSGKQKPLWVFQPWEFNMRSWLYRHWRNENPKRKHWSNMAGVIVRSHYLSRLESQAPYVSPPSPMSGLSQRPVFVTQRSWNPEPYMWVGWVLPSRCWEFKSTEELGRLPRWCIYLSFWGWTTQVSSKNTEIKRETEANCTSHSEGHCLEDGGRNRKEPAFSPPSSDPYWWKLTGSRQATQKCDLQSPPSPIVTQHRVEGWVEVFIFVIGL